MPEIISIRFKREGKQYYFDPRGLTVATGDGVILETSWGMEFGTCVRGNTMVSEEDIVSPLRPIVRLATPEDYAQVKRNRAREKEAFALCREKIALHGLDMKLVDVEFGFEGSKVLFFFTSEGRVDFRALVKDLAAVFHTRIELRQIGVRDEAKMLGGLGICGRPFCCSSFLRDFQPVSIKMAKTQSLSLNPGKISGTCGRLMCCLKYEQEAYEDLLQHSPKSDSFVETPDGVGDIISVNILREKVRVRLDNEPDSLKIYHNSEIRVIRSGKGRRPEDYIPPSPKDLEKLRKVQTELLEEVSENRHGGLRESYIPTLRGTPATGRQDARVGQHAKHVEKTDKDAEKPRGASRGRHPKKEGVSGGQKPKTSHRKAQPPASAEKAKEGTPQRENNDTNKRHKPYWRKKPTGQNKKRKEP